MRKEEHIIFYDKAGNAVGLGKEVVITEPIKDIIGGHTTQRFIVSNGATTGWKQAIDETTAKDIQDPNSKLSLKDFKTKAVKDQEDG